MPAGARHNLANTEKDEDLKIVTVYAPPEHAVGTVHRSKADAIAAESREEEEAATAS